MFAEKCYIYFCQIVRLYLIFFFRTGANGVQRVKMFPHTYKLAHKNNCSYISNSPPIYELFDRETERDLQQRFDLEEMSLSVCVSFQLFKCCIGKTAEKISGNRFISLTLNQREKKQEFRKNLKWPK